MDIYQQKSTQKIILLVCAIVIGLLTTVYTNYLSSKIANEERNKAKLWAEAIARKAKLVKYTNVLFSKLADDDRNKVHLWAKATEFTITAEDEELNFFTEIITGNKDIPVILTDASGNIIDYRNFEPIEKQSKMNISMPEFESFRIYAPIVVRFINSKNFIYYKDSNIFSELKKTLNDLISSFINEVVLNTASAPVILTNEKNELFAFGNLDSVNINTEKKLRNQIALMDSRHEPIQVDLGEGGVKWIHYDDSTILKQLKIFPFIQLAIFALFLFFSYFAFSNARRAEQNLVWVGMAKETAHQLGTPISSLSAWVEYLREHDSFKHNVAIVDEMEMDVERLTLVADRFSKIGSSPQLNEENVYDLVQKNVQYFQKRSSKDAHFKITNLAEGLKAKINVQLFDWVMENLLKNALDAMNGVGHLDIQLSEDFQYAVIDVKDSGCGISKRNFETIFEPGYSTKRRGWGLGLSLTKRIVEDYHNGRIFVKESTSGKGTTIRVQIPKA